MPELTVKEIRLPELHLPEMQRDDIVRTLSEIHVPEVELPSLDAIASARPTLDLSGIDLGKAVAGAMAAARIVTPAVRRPRWPIALGVVAILGVIALAMLRSPVVRERADRATKLARERIDAMRADATSAADEIDEIEVIDVVEPFDAEIPTPA